MTTGGDPSCALHGQFLCNCHIFPLPRHSTEVYMKNRHTTALQFEAHRRKRMILYCKCTTCKNVDKINLVENDCLIQDKTTQDFVKHYTQNYLCFTCMPRDGSGGKRKDNRVKFARI